MTKKFERYLIVFLLLILLGLSGCVSKQQSIETKGQKAPTTLDTIGKLDAISTVLGCLFDPTPCQKANKKLQEEIDNDYDQ
tara:strand:- start:564 stop:806 length:243 start_codon:yes stop_codon:yes gene_type:complete